MATPQHHIHKVVAMVASIEALPSVEFAVLNDWGRYSNFDIKIYKPAGGSYRPAINAMKRYCKEHGMIYRGHNLPHPKDYHQCMSVDIDFIPYDAASNTFEGQN